MVSLDLNWVCSTLPWRLVELLEMECLDNITLGVNPLDPAMERFDDCLDSNGCDPGTLELEEIDELEEDFFFSRGSSSLWAFKASALEYLDDTEEGAEARPPTLKRLDDCLDSNCPTSFIWRGSSNWAGDELILSWVAFKVCALKFLDDTEERAEARLPVIELLDDCLDSNCPTFFIWPGSSNWAGDELILCWAAFKVSALEYLDDIARPPVLELLDDCLDSNCPTSFIWPGSSNWAGDELILCWAAFKVSALEHLDDIEEGAKARPPALERLDDCLDSNFPTSFIWRGSFSWASDELVLSWSAFKVSALEFLDDTEEGAKARPPALERLDDCLDSNFPTSFIWRGSFSWASDELVLSWSAFKVSALEFLDDTEEGAEARPPALDRLDDCRESNRPTFFISFKFSALEYLDVTGGDADPRPTVLDRLDDCLDKNCPTSFTWPISCCWASDELTCSGTAFERLALGGFEGADGADPSLLPVELLKKMT